ncbi:hypothetical protein ACDN41_11910 [Priestia aryabhattai]|uniref:hypothetical protein n=1 Tax=Priestia aryabhattai TaxID=412384 RepID=UPI003532403A
MSNWTIKEDLSLINLIINHLKEGSTMSNAYRDAAEMLNKDVSECEYRWSKVLSDFYSEVSVFAHLKDKLYTE